LPERLSGIILSWHWSQSGDFCFLEASNHQRYFLHRKEIANYVQPIPGSRVEFTPAPLRPDAKGLAKLPQALDALVIHRKPTVNDVLGGGGR